jgi:hypothetical protein
VVETVPAILAGERPLLKDEVPPVSPVFETGTPYSGCRVDSQAEIPGFIRYTM